MSRKKSPRTSLGTAMAHPVPAGVLVSATSQTSSVVISAVGISDLQALAHTLDVAPARLAEVIDDVCAGLPQAFYYVFRADMRDWPQPPRVITAFPDPDSALAFTQRQGELAPARLLPVGVRDLLRLLLSDAAIDALEFVDVLPAATEPARSLRVERRVLLQELTEVPAVPELTARAYDNLQFGVDFVQRGAFRAALATALEGVVACYVPPPGSLDLGARSVYATTAVEAWLRDNG